jgi:signal peptidase I
MSKETKNLEKKSSLREWIEAIVIAVFVATTIRWFAVEHYMVPTSSMENTILVGDHLLVSKLHYGARTPVTPLQLPLTHKTIGSTGIKSYSTWCQWRSWRFPGFSKIKRGDMVVFNYPMELESPVDLREFYIKRCVALPGDIVKIENCQLYINDQLSPTYAGIQFRYYIKTDEVLSESFFKKYSIYETFRMKDGYIFNATQENIDKLKNCTFIKEALRIVAPRGDCDYRFYTNESCVFNWNLDFFGPTIVPKKGMTILINKETLAQYGSCIINHDCEKEVFIDDDHLYIGRKQVEEYTFRQDYFFMMGDNRHNSIDSRYTGFVPYDHIVGKAILILFARDTKEQSLLHSIRWSRIFKAL